MKKLFPFIKGYGVRSLLASLTIIAEVIIEVYIPYLMADIINIGIETGDIRFILRRGLFMIFMACLSLSMGALSARFAVTASAGFAKNLRAALFYKVQDFSFANVDRFSTASLITRLTTDVTSVQMVFMMMIRTFIRSPLMLVSATVMAVRLNAKLAVVFAFAIPVLAAFLVLIGTRAFPRFKEMLRKYDGMNGEVQENLIAIRVVKAFVREKYETDRFIDSAEAVRDAQIKAEKLLVWNGPIAQYVLYLCMIAVCFIGGRLIIAGDMLTGDLMSFISYVTQILSSLMMVSMIFVSFIMTRASISRIVEVLDEKIDISDEEADASLTVKDGSIEFRDVSFSYAKDGNNLTLQNVNLSIKSGETIGIIGGTGSAKTTLVQLIPRLYDVYGGSVAVGGVDVRDYKIETLRDSVSMVLQKNVLFSGTIRENLRWGDPDATDEEIKAAAKAAAAHDFITSFPNGYETELGQGGVNVSGGQKQRLCIARALLKKPKIIILDDSTSAVDTATDASIRKALREELRDTTTLIIAQRITSVMDADRIIVMEDGTISDVGTHEELMQRSEIYREVYESQQKGVA
ncbi:MAG: ABC transporter ATP-binding protein [Clostridiales bacterium]|nr:ABC transporter ATP-binding protein [Clostridiales bacterium]